MGCARCPARVFQSPIAALLFLSVCVPAVPHAAAQSVRIEGGSAVGRPGDRVDLTVSLDRSGASVAATANDLTFNNLALDLDPEGCRINPTIAGKSLTATILRDSRSSRTLRLFVQSIDNVEPIPDGPLYTCTFTIAVTALPSTYRVTIGTVLAFAPDGMKLGRVSGTNGSVVVSLVVVATPTPTPSHTPTATVTPTRTPDPCPPELALVPASGPPATRVGFSGTCALIRLGRRATVLFDAVHVTSVGGDTDGTYRGIFMVPGEATPGVHEVRVLMVQGEIASATFEVTGPRIICAGDCNADREVTISELLTAIGIALDGGALSECPAADANEDGAVAIDELLAGVQGALDGCAATVANPLPIRSGSAATP